jgi:hypothetical protein
MAKDIFTTHGVYCDSVYTAYEIEISKDGSYARVRYSITTTNSIQYSRPRWQEIKFTRSGVPFVTYNHKRLQLDNFLRP